MNKDIGGTWLQNTYPGCRCDITSHMYPFSFEMNPGTTTAYIVNLYANTQIKGGLKIIVLKLKYYNI